MAIEKQLNLIKVAKTKKNPEVKTMIWYRVLRK